MCTGAALRLHTCLQPGGRGAARRIATAPPTGLNPNWVRSSGGMVLGAALRRGGAVGLLLAARARNGPAPAAHHPRKHLAGAAGEYAPRDVRRLARDAVDPTRFRKLPPPWRGLPRREWARGRARHVYGGAAPQGRGGRVDIKKKIERQATLIVGLFSLARAIELEGEHLPLSHRT